jgi:hypothetical protein
MTGINSRAQRYKMKYNNENPLETNIEASLNGLIIRSVAISTPGIINRIISGMLSR